MVAEYLCTQGDSVTGSHGLVGPNLDGQLVKVSLVAHTGVFHRVIDLEDRSVYGIDRDGANGCLGRLILISGNIASAMVENKLHIQSAVRSKCCNRLLGVEDLHLSVCLDVAGGDKSFAGGFNVDGFGAGAVQAGDDALNIQNDLRHVLFHAGDGGKLMLYTGNFDAGAGGSGERRKEYPAKRVTKCSAIAALQRLNDVFAI